MTRMVRLIAGVALGTCAGIGFAAWGLGVSADESRDFRTFKASKHGFAFVNSFRGSSLPISLGGLEHRLGAPERFGLCGGMAFAAADLFLAARAVPTTGTPPARGSRLFAYINKRQIDSLGENMRYIGVFGRCMSAPDSGFHGLHALTSGEIESMKAGLDAGRPVVLGLVYCRHANNKHSSAPIGDPWNNHQVLATTAGEGAGGAWTITIYDPNYPKRDDVTIVCTPLIADTACLAPMTGHEMPILGVECVQHVGAREKIAVRALFPMPYVAVEPPAGIR